VSSLAWTPISPLETANWLNWTITSLWAEILRPRFTDDVKLAIARQLLTTKLPWFIASVRSGGWVGFSTKRFVDLR